MYDGNNLTISNWSYVDAAFNTGTGTPIVSVGLFGYVVGTVKNVRLAGVCTLSGHGKHGGMVVGRLDGGTLYNIDCNLSTGSFLEQGDEPSLIAEQGGVVGIVEDSSNITALTFRGEIDSIRSSVNVSRPVLGGVVGSVLNSTVTLLRNLATFGTLGPQFLTFLRASIFIV